MDAEGLDFETLVKLNAAGPKYCDTFAYWIGCLSNPASLIAQDADEACAAMSHQFNVEEQSFDWGGLCGYPQYVPRIFAPVAPVTVALRWSPFPTAIAALGSPFHFATGTFGHVLTVFRPREILTQPASGPDRDHFQLLLQHANERALSRKKWILLCGSPGWSYNLTEEAEGDLDCCYENDERMESMKEFGFIHFSRKPANPGR